MLQQKRILRRFSCHRLERGSESIQRQLEKGEGHCELHSCSVVFRNPSNGHVSSTRAEQHGAQGSAVGTENCAKGPCLPRPWSVSVLHQSLQFSWVKKTGSLEVVLPVFWSSSRTGLVLHQKKLIMATCILGISAGFGCNLSARNPSISSCLQLGIYQIPTNGIQKHLRV